MCFREALCQKNWAKKIHLRKKTTQESHELSRGRDFLYKHEIDRERKNVRPSKGKKAG